jgi:hypothetical protein
MATTCRYRSNSAGDHSGAVSGTINGAGRGGSSGKVPPTVADPASGEGIATAASRTAITPRRAANDAPTGWDATLLSDKQTM